MKRSREHITIKGDHMKYIDIEDMIENGGAVIKGSEAVKYLQQLAKDCIYSGDEK